MSLHQCIFSVKAIISNLTSFISETSAVIFLNVQSNIAASKTTLWARPLKTEYPKLIV